jgi:integrase/recombinase XerD
MNFKPVVSVILDIRKANKAKLFPIKLRATFQVSKKGENKWIQKYYPLKLYVSKSDFKTIISGTARTLEHKEIKAEIIKAQARANKILETHTYVNIEVFDTLYTGISNLVDVQGVFDFKISELQKEGRIGSRDMYRAVKNSIVKYCGGLTFYEITKEWINKYVTWLRSHKEGDKTISVSSTTVNIYLRQLRAIYNMAIYMRLINRDMYPFGRGGFLIKKSQARKIALSEVDKNRLLALQDPELRHAVDFWMLSYFCYGLNITDILLLKVRDLKDDLLIIDREKKKNTDASGKKLVIPIRKEVKEIILRWGNKTLNPNDYVFPILTEGLTPEQMKDRTKDFTKRINDGLKKVAEKLELDVKLTTYTARHTFATMALRKGASKEFIQDALGHTSIMTTENYLSGFDVEAKRAMSEKL